MRAHSTIGPTLPAASDHMDAGEEPETQAPPPTGAVAVPLALRRPAQGEPDARALHHMPEAAGQPRTWTAEGGTRKARTPPGPRMKCGWGCGAQLTICAKRPAGSEDVDHRRRNSRVKRDRLLGPRMLCGWCCSSRLTASQMRTTSPYTRSCRRVPTWSRRRDTLKVKTWPPSGTADEMRLGLRRAAYPAQYARALHHMREAASGLTPRGPTREEVEG